MNLPPSLYNLIREFSRFPGIGPKTSERLVFWLLQQPKGKTASFIQALTRFTQTLHTCPQCFNFTDNGENALCAICSDEKRDQRILCVVADVLDLLALEATQYSGLYHVLGGTVNPLKGIHVEQLRVKELKQRIQALARFGNPFQEIILAFDPNHEGELTSHYLKRELLHFEIKITRLGRGLPQGGDLDYADEVTLGEALGGRKDF